MNASQERQHQYEADDAIGAFSWQPWKDILADDISENDQKDAQRQSADACRLAESLKKRRVHGHSAIG